MRFRLRVRLWFCRLGVVSRKTPMAPRSPPYRTPKAGQTGGDFHPLWVGVKTPPPVGIGKITETLNYWFTLIVVLRIYEERAAPACC